MSSTEKEGSMTPLYGQTLLALARRQLSPETDEWIHGPIDMEPHPNVSSRERDAIYMIIKEKCFLTGLVPSTQAYDKIARKADVEKIPAHEFQWTFSMSADDQKLLEYMCRIFPEHHSKYRLYVLRYERNGTVYYTLVVGKGKRPHQGYAVNYWGNDSSPKFEELVEDDRGKTAPRFSQELEAASPGTYIVPEDIHDAELNRWIKVSRVGAVAFCAWLLTTSVAHYYRIETLFWLMLVLIGIAAMFVLGFSRPSGIHSRK